MPFLELESNTPVAFTNCSICLQYIREFSRFSASSLSIPAWSNAKGQSIRHTLSDRAHCWFEFSNTPRRSGPETPARNYIPNSAQNSQRLGLVQREKSMHNRFKGRKLKLANEKTERLRLSSSFLFLYSLKRGDWKKACRRTFGLAGGVQTAILANRVRFLEFRNWLCYILGCYLFFGSRRVINFMV